MKKNVAKSVRDKLFNITKRDGLVYQTIITRYLYERLLYRLSQSDYRNKFYLKGGALLYAIEQEHPRPTLDMDFLGVKISNDLANIKNIFMKICSIECDSDGVEFDIESISTANIAEEKNYKGVRVIITVHLDSIKQIMKIDIGFGDTVVPSPVNLAYPSFMNELPEVNIMAYSLESVVAEKFNAMIELEESNSRYKDFYDVYKILSNNSVDANTLIEAIVSTFRNRGTNYYDNHTLFTDKFTRNEVRLLQWNRFVKKIKYPYELPFEEVMRLITLTLQPIYEKLK